MLYMLTFQFGLCVIPASLCQAVLTGNHSGPLTYTYTAEIGSARLRSRVIAWGNICNQFFSLIIQIMYVGFRLFRCHWGFADGDAATRT